MTSDTTQTDLVTVETGNLRELITNARFVLFDFDGPICRLFAGHTAEQVAKELVAWLEGQGLQGLLTEEERVHPDPMVVLYAVNRRHPQSDLVTELEERLTQHERKAVVSAMPTAYADPLIRTWKAVGSRLAVATNNSPRTVSDYLSIRGLADCFAPHVYGRTSRLDLLKPNPHCLNRALNALGAAPSAALMIGDAPTDLYAAEEAGVPFLGYARNEDKARQLREAGAEVVVGSLLPVLRVLRDQA
ncbi:haloacid dehalogenase superfamily, subfamily IA, variant 3 with third motif having DD or ED [Streptomyces sp. cf386]|uniref:HAD family hydrolase n=1 Tax=Streptomyces sp. cf386 TaxID=1761904 RepID=UPI00088C30EA|nr:HAD family hydrolase [Streptomyces sp. cf386]SDM64672.1 haloacid dehalogenase superfamily, subfamily IA, variant 3 with third motif having DD or ED [Streptomyces sp. cf386]